MNLSTFLTNEKKKNIKISYRQKCINEYKNNFVITLKPGLEAID